MKIAISKKFGFQHYFQLKSNTISIGRSLKNISSESVSCWQYYTNKCIWKASEFDKKCILDIWLLARRASQDAVQRKMDAFRRQKIFGEREIILNDFPKISNALLRYM
jgi:hypothetical protein